MANFKTESSKSIEDQMDNFDAKLDNIELVNAPESCLDLVHQGINQSQMIFMDPDGRNVGSQPIQVFCKLPEALAISGEEIEIPIVSQCSEPGCFNHEFEYDQNTMEQLITLTRVSSKCSQTFEFHCLSAPLKDPVS